MAYKIDISPTAIADVEACFEYIKLYSVDSAHKWLRGCYEKMLTLERFPNRCALAVESQYLPLDLRQLLYQKHYRILFTVVEVQDAMDGRVQVHRVLRSSQARLQDLSELLGDAT